MIWSKVRRELRQSPWQSLLVTGSVLLATALAGVGTAFGVQLIASNGVMFSQAEVPQVVQMHAGSIDTRPIHEFAAEEPNITRTAVVELISLDSATVSLTPGTTEASSAIEYSATIASTAGDRLLALDGTPAHVDTGTLGMPIDIALDRGIEVGDTVTLAGREFTVSTLIRDAMMGSDLSSSRRLLISEADAPLLRAGAAGQEWLIEFWLTDASLAPKVYDAYLGAALPANGPMIDFATLQLLAGMSTGTVVGILLVVAILLAGIATLLLSITVRTSIAAAAQQIGVLRAIGLPRRMLRRIVLSRHLLLIAVGAVVGAGVAATVIPAATESMRLRFGGTLSPATFLVIGLVGALAALASVLLSWAAVRSALRGNIIEAMRGVTRGKSRSKLGKAGSATGTPAAGNASTSADRPAWLITGLPAIRRNRADHFTVLAISFVATLLAVVPASLATTISSTEFIRTTGIAVSDVLITVRADTTSDERVNALKATLRADPEVAHTTTLSTERLAARNAEGEWTGINIATGDHTAFPLDYTSGHAPTATTEIALSELNAESFGVQVGDRLTLEVDGAERALDVVGVYRDVTNSGRTAQAHLPAGSGEPLWSSVLVEFTPGTDVAAATDRYAELAAPARVTDVESARDDVLGAIDRSLTSVSWIAAAAALALIVLITSLIMRLFLARDERRRAVAQALGASPRPVRAEYLFRVGVPAALGIVIGAATATLIGSSLFTLAGQFFGASGLPLHANPILMVAVPAILAGAVCAVIRLSVGRLTPSRTARVIAGQDT